jgi:hypothetical protein
MDDIIVKMYRPDTLDLAELRNNLYDILIYNLDVSECICYIVTHVISSESINSDEANHLLEDVYEFFKYYNNNYRPIYHLESIIMNIMKKIHYE